MVFPDPKHAPKQAPAIDNPARIIYANWLKHPHRTILLRYCQSCYSLNCNVSAK
jgi:hypothetical protein